MENRTYTLTDINEDLIHYVDRYLKKVIINAKRRYYRCRNKKEKYGIIFVDLDSFEEELGYEDNNYDAVICQYIEVKGRQIPVYEPKLAEALLSLTEIQRQILIESVCWNIKLKEISVDLKISERMVRKHKRNAIESIRRRMQKNEEF